MLILVCRVDTLPVASDFPVEVRTQLFFFYFIFEVFFTASCRI